VVLAGIGQYLDKASSNNVGDRWSFSAIILLSLIIGPLRGVVTLYVGGVIFGWIGRLLGGQGSTVEVRAAIAWSQTPLIWVSLLWIPELWLFGPEMFTANTPIIDSNPLLLFTLFGFGVIEIIVGLWVFVVFLKCLGEVHRFSAWKALATTLLPLVVIFVLITVLAGASLSLM